MADNDLQANAFPSLDETQIERLARVPGVTARVYQDGDCLIAAGAHNFNFFIITAGHAVVTGFDDDATRLIADLGPGQFTGNITALLGGPSAVGVKARGACEVYEIPRDSLQHILVDCPRVSDLMLQAFIARWQLLRVGPSFTGLRVMGSRYDPNTFRIREFLVQNHILFTWVDVEAHQQVEALLKHFRVDEDAMPLVICSGKVVLRNPTNLELADKLGIHKPLDRAVYDLVVIGAGPAGLAAAVYGASEGLRTAIVERTATGGQAGRSMRIENYLGFPTGITGEELATRAAVQVSKFGAVLDVPAVADSLRFDNTYAVVRLDDGSEVTAKCLLLAIGVDYRRLVEEGCERFEGAGVFYAATPIEAQMCRAAQVVVVGGGNSAGQAAVFLAEHARQVHLVVRADSLDAGMSSYLARRIEIIPNVRVHVHSAVRHMNGNDHLRTVDLQDLQSGKTSTIETQGLFCFIGAVPRTEWLPPEITRDDHGFIQTGPSAAESSYWQPGRPPFFLETSHPGVFAAGDVRSGSIKRVASAVGEGSMAVQFVHEYLREK